MTTVLAEWGMAGITALRDQVALFVIVDVLSFSTAVDVAVSRGALVYPFPLGDRLAAQNASNAVGAVLAEPRRTAGGQFSLSPVSLKTIAADTRLMLPSPNGARLSLTSHSRPVLAGCLRNAASVAQTALALAKGAKIGVVPAGESWPDGSLRPAAEDMLGAGAIIHHMSSQCSPEAQILRDVFRATQGEVAALIRSSVSGRELIEAGFADDVEMAVEYNVSQTVPLLTEGAFRAK